MLTTQSKYSYLKKPIFLWLVWFGVNSIVAILVCLSEIPIRLGYRYTDIGVSFGLPEWIGVHANFDGVHYMTIAREGYGTLEQAFFPLYPLVIRYASPILFGNTLLAGWIISVLLSLFAVITWYMIFHKLAHNTDEALSSIVGLLLFPGAFFLISIYTESLFVFLLGLYVWGVVRNKYWLVGIAGLLLGLTRLAGILAILIPLPLIVQIYLDSRRINIRQILTSMMPLVGLGLYVGYSSTTFGDPLAFFHIQTQFNNGRSTSMVLLPQVLWRYFNIFFKARVDVLYFVAVVEFVVFLVVLALLFWSLMKGFRNITTTRKATGIDLLMIGLLLFSIANILLPTVTGTFTSIPRYALVGMGLYPVVSSLPRPIRIVGCLLSSILQIVLFAFFAQGWFVG